MKSIPFYPHMKMRYDCICLVLTELFFNICHLSFNVCNFRNADGNLIGELQQIGVKCVRSWEKDQLIEEIKFSRCISVHLKNIGQSCIRAPGTILLLGINSS